MFARHFGLHHKPSTGALLKTVSTIACQSQEALIMNLFAFGLCVAWI